MFKKTKFQSLPSIACRVNKASPPIAASFPASVSMAKGASAMHNAPAQPMMGESILADALKNDAKLCLGQITLAGGQGQTLANSGKILRLRRGFRASGASRSCGLDVLNADALRLADDRAM